MTTHAYDELYAGRARIALGNMLHFAVYDLKWDISKFYMAFINSGIAKRFGNGEPRLTVGLSGAELAYEVILKTTGEKCLITPAYSSEKSPEYWAGWALAYYEWYRDTSFERINKIIPIEEVINMYSPLHEADITKFIEIMDELISKAPTENRLARIRAYSGLTQKLLAEKSGVSVRMIEQYEQGKKDIKRASSETVYKLSKALGCDMSDLIT
ncbi:MAG: helix-turn-helix transcriptional regulator [Lachnospiraceae bacterium]|nr:helix-turn-helix transcriptional regulator [Lachnospiraceae bacterium]